MTMMRRTFVAAVLALFVLTVTSPAASAHEEYRLVGTLVKVEKTEPALYVVSIKFKWAPTDQEELVADVYVWSTTVITRDSKEVPASELKAGLSVVIDALGDDWMHSDALSVRIVPPIGK
jgi:hypothetical protein